MLQQVIADCCSKMIFPGPATPAENETSETGPEVMGIALCHGESMLLPVVADLIIRESASLMQIAYP